MTNSKERAQPTVDQIVRVLRMLLEWAQGQGHIPNVAFPKDALPKRRRKQQEATADAAQSSN